MWHELLDKVCSKSLTPEIQTFPDIFIRKLGEISPELLAGQHGLELTEDETDLIQDRLIEKLPFRLSKIARHIFRYGLSHGNDKKRWHNALPPHSIPLPRPTNPIKPLDFMLGDKLNHINNIFIENLTEILEENPKVLAGAVIFSAAAHGSLSSSKRIELLASVTTEHIFMEGGVCRIELSPHETWYPTSLPETLLRCFLRKHGLPLVDKAKKDFADNVPTALQALGNALNLPADLKKLLAQRLPALCKFENSISVPGYLLAYLYQANRATPLESHSAHRFFTGDDADSEAYSNPAETTKAPKPLRLNEENATPQELICLNIQRVLGTLAEHARTMTVDEAVEKIEQLKKSLSSSWPILGWLADYAIHSIRITREKRGAFSSSLRFFSEIWFPLLSKTQDANPKSFDQNSVEAWIDELIIWRSNPASRYYFQNALKHFLKFIEIDFDSDGLDFWVPNASGRPHASLVTPFEFDQLIIEISSDDYFKQPWKKRLAVLATTLCYRMGLRRREPTILRVCDLQLGATPELVVRESDFGRLKSDQAERRIPLNGLLTQQEIRDLLKYRRERESDGGFFDPLFVDPQHPKQPLKPEVIFHGISKALRKVTGDQNAVPHLLRHSFVNLGIAKLHFADHVIEIPTTISAFSHPMMSLEASVQFKDAIFHREPYDPLDTGRRNLFAMMMLTGHLSPSTTVSSYFHLADLLVYLFREREQPVVTCSRARAKLLGVGKTRMYQIAELQKIEARDFGINQILCELRKRDGCNK
jgi:integrase